MLKVFENKKYKDVSSLLAACHHALKTKGSKSKAYQVAVEKLEEKCRREKEVWKRRAESIRLVP